MSASNSYIWFCLGLCNAGTYSEPSQTSNIKPFVKIINSFQRLSIFAKSSILDIWISSGCVFASQAKIELNLSISLFS